MDNQHRQIDGYRDFGQSTVDQINTIKAAERDLAALHRQIADVPDVDPPLPGNRPHQAPGSVHVDGTCCSQAGGSLRMNTPKANTVALDNLLNSIARGYNVLYNELAAHVDDVGQPVVEVALREVRRSLSDVVRCRIEVWMEEREYTTPR